MELPGWFDEFCLDEKRDTLEDDPMPTHTLLIWLGVAWLAAVGGFLVGVVTDLAGVERWVGLACWGIGWGGATLQEVALRRAAPRQSDTIRYRVTITTGEQKP